MHLCIFNPEHDLCMAKGRAHYVPPRSAVDFARRDAALMQVLYPEATCCSVYDIENFNFQFSIFNSVTAWGWDAVVKHELLKHGCPESLLPSDDELTVIRDLQHRSTVLPLQPDCHAVYNIEEMEALLREREHWVLKAPWSGAGRGLRWVHGTLTTIDRDWLNKTVREQRCAIAEPRREVLADVALEYRVPSYDATPHFIGYSYFRTGSGVYKENIAWSDDRIETTFGLRPIRQKVERWLTENVCHRYRGPLGVDLMVCTDRTIHVSEINFRHTMGMVAHERILKAL